MYFLIIALSPLSSAAFYYYFKIIPFSVYIVSFTAMIIVLQYHKNKKIRIGLALLVFSTSIAIFLNDQKIDALISVILNGVIISYFYYFLLDFVYRKRAINFYFIALVVYELSILLKMFTLLTNIQMGVPFYHLTSLFEILICIYFIFFNVENSPQFKFHEI
jgi:hypothetical protein